MPREPDRILFESENLRATFKPAGGRARPLVITFAQLDANLSLERAGFGDPWVGDAGYDAAHVVSAGNNWYQFPEMPALFAALREHASHYPTAVTYGSSMGGHAAVRFAGRVGARTAIALSPQFSIDPARAPFDDRWRQWAKGVVFRWEDPDPSDAQVANAWVLYDPRDKDRLHVEAFARHYPVRALPLLHAGHPAGVYLSEAGLLASAIVEMIEGVFDAQRFLAEARVRRRRTGKYFETLALRNRTRRPRLALNLAAEAAARVPRSPSYAALHALLACEAGQLEDAESLARRALELGADYPMQWVLLAESLFAGGQREAALEWTRAAQGGEDGRVQRRLSDLFFLMGEDRASLTAAKAARRLIPATAWGLARSFALPALLACPALGKPVLDWIRRRNTRTSRGGSK